MNIQNIREVIKTVVFEFENDHEDLFTFRAEILKIDDKFTVDLYKLEVLSVIPCGNSIKDDELRSEILWIYVNQFLDDDEPRNSVDECLQKVFDSLKKQAHKRIF